MCSSHLSVQSPASDRVADPDASGSDSGRGNSDDGNDLRGAGAPRDVKVTSSMSNMRTFVSAAPVTSASSPQNCDVNDDINFKTVYARPVQVYTSPPVTSAQPPHDVSTFSPTDPRHTRVYYKNFPTYSTPAPFRPPPLGLNRTQRPDTSTFV